MTYQDIFDRVRRLLNDRVVPYRWADETLRLHAGTVLRRMAEVAPPSCSAVRTMELAAGSLQALPSWAVRFMGGVRRVADNKSVRNVHPEVMDTVLPGWRDADQSEEITDCIYDQAVPNEFSVYPPAIEDTELDIRVSVRVDDPVTNDETIPVNAVNEIALIHGILGMAFAQDTDAADMGTAAQHWGQFYEALGVQRTIDGENPPQAKEDKG